MKKTKRLSRRMTMYLIVFAIVCSSVMGLLGYRTYSESVSSHYSKYVETITAFALHLIDADELEKCIRDNRISKEWNQSQQVLNRLKTYSQIEYIYIITTIKNKNECTYVVSGQRPGSEYMSQNHLGESAEELPGELKSEVRAVMEGRSKGRHIPNRFNGEYVLTGIIPIENSQGQIIASMNVEVSMDKMAGEQMDYVTRVFAVTAVLIGVFLILFLGAVHKSIVRPIVSIGKQADSFIALTQSGIRPQDISSDKDFIIMLDALDIHTGDETEKLADQLRQMMQNVVEYMSRIESAASAQERFSVQLNVAKQIQNSMIPNHYPLYPERDEFQVYGLMEPAVAVGGDFYDFFMIDETRLGMVIAEVSGDGVSATLFMMLAKTLIKNQTILGLEPAKVFEEVNNQLCENNGAEMTVSALLCILELQSGVMTLVSAGRHEPLVCKGNGEFECVALEQGFLLGALEKVPFYQQNIVLDQGDVFFIHTLGVVKAKNQKEQSFEKSRLKEKLSQAWRKEIASPGTYEYLKSVLEQVKADIGIFMEGTLQEEDLTMALLQFGRMPIFEKCWHFM